MSGKIKVSRVYLKGDYDDTGTYFGSDSDGNKLYFAECQATDESAYVRARSFAEAKAGVAAARSWTALRCEGIRI